MLQAKMSKGKAPNNARNAVQTKLHVTIIVFLLFCIISKLETAIQMSVS
jgi:hypothetical protein